MSEVTVKVFTDLSHDMPEEVSKGVQELPNKFYVEYVDILRNKKPEFADLSQKEPNSAILYDSYEDYKAKKTGKSIDMTLPATQNGITTNGMAICFILNNQAG